MNMRAAVDNDDILQCKNRVIGFITFLLSLSQPKSSLRSKISTNTYLLHRDWRFKAGLPSLYDIHMFMLLLFRIMKCLKN